MFLQPAAFISHSLATVSHKLTQKLFPATSGFEQFFLFWYVGLVPKICPDLCLTP
jgi:hypothetical protein